MLGIVIAFDVDLLETCLRTTSDHPTHLHERRPIPDILENIHILLVSMESACTLPMAVPKFASMSGVTFHR